jgi:hypothetical protein
MAARAIVGIALGMLFLPVIWLLLVASQFPIIPLPLSPGPDLTFWNWITSITTNFNGFLTSYLAAGMGALTTPLITLFVLPGMTIANYLSWFAAGIITWAIIGMWAGAVERSAGRGIGVAVGIWLGWVIIEIIYWAISGSLTILIAAIMDQWFGLVIAIIAAAIFGAITKSEEF